VIPGHYWCFRCGWWCYEERVPRLGVAYPTSSRRLKVDADLDTLATALYVRVDDLLKNTPERAPARPKTGFVPRLRTRDGIT